MFTPMTPSGDNKHLPCTNSETVSGCLRVFPADTPVTTSRCVHPAAIAGSACKPTTTPVTPMKSNTYVINTIAHTVKDTIAHTVKECMDVNTARQVTQDATGQNIHNEGQTPFTKCDTRSSECRPATDCCKDCGKVPSGDKDNDSMSKYSFNETYTFDSVLNGVGVLNDTPLDNSSKNRNSQAHSVEKSTSHHPRPHRVQSTHGDEKSTSHHPHSHKMQSGNGAVKSTSHHPQPHRVQSTHGTEKSTSHHPHSHRVQSSNGVEKSTSHHPHLHRAPSINGAEKSTSHHPNSHRMQSTNGAKKSTSQPNLHKVQSINRTCTDSQKTTPEMIGAEPPRDLVLESCVDSGTVTKTRPTVDTVPTENRVRRAIDFGNCPSPAGK